jgi:hypothetical protein
MSNCKKHPKYQAKKAPTSDCLDCWKQYAAKLELELLARKDVINVTVPALDRAMSRELTLGWLTGAGLITLQDIADAEDDLGIKPEYRIVGEEDNDEA